MIQAATGRYRVGSQQHSVNNELMTPAYATATIRHEHWTITSRTDPRQRAKHDFRNTLQALVLAAEGGDMEYARGLLVDLEARYEAAAAMAKR